MRVMMTSRNHNEKKKTSLVPHNCDGECKTGQMANKSRVRKSHTNKLVSAWKQEQTQLLNPKCDPFFLNPNTEREKLRGSIILIITPRSL